MEDRKAALAGWPTVELAGRLIAERAALSCYRAGSDRCRACFFAMELPLALARASDAAERDGDNEAAQHLLESAMRAACSLAPAVGSVAAFR